MNCLVCLCACIVKNVPNTLKLSLSLFQMQQGIGKPSVYHAVMVIFLEFFAWGLLTTPMLTVSLFSPLSSISAHASSLLIIAWFFFLFVFFPRSGSTRNVPTAHVPDERPHSGSEGEAEGDELFLATGSRLLLLVQSVICVTRACCLS